MGIFSSIGSAIGGFVSSTFSAIGSFVSSVGGALSGGLSMMVDGLSGVFKGIGEGIKSLCEAVGSEALALIGSSALSLLMPGIGLPELFVIIQIIAEIAKILGVDEGEDSPEELGMKAEIAEKKPEDFDSTKEYIKYLNEKVELNKEDVSKLSELDRAKYGAMGAAMQIKAIEEEYKISLSPEFLKDINTLKLEHKETADYIKTFKENGIDNMQDMSNYLRGRETESSKSEISSSMKEVLAETYPELSEDAIEEKLLEMKEQIFD